VRARSEDRRHEHQIGSDPPRQRSLATVVNGNGPQTARREQRAMMGAVSTPCPRDSGPVGEQDEVTPLTRLTADSAKKPVAVALRKAVVAKYNATPARQTRNRTVQVIDARVGHQPDAGERVAGAHGAAYSAAMTEAESRLSKIRERIAKAQRSPAAAAQATLIAVSKTHDAAAIAPLIAAGQRDFGENRVQEALAKWPALVAGTPDIRLHLVGQLQSNKAVEAVALFDVIHSVDRPSLVSALARAMDKAGKRPDCFVQVNLEGGEGKGGCAIDTLPALLAEARAAQLPVIGLMCVPPEGLEPSPWFALLAKLARDHGVGGLSMGMSGDFETAIALGATHIRVGTALFGSRT